MQSIKEIGAPVSAELKEFNKRFKASMKSSVPLLDKVTSYMLKRKGKQIRPLFVLFSAKATGTINDQTYIAASLVELLHTATLVHDDIVDDSNERRGIFSINALWKNKIAVLVGDYLLSQGLLISLDAGAYQLLQIASRAVKEMSEGELLQIEKARRLDISEEIYFEIIRKKTASLIASCCAVGAASSGADEQTIEMMRLFGEKAGIAFQIKDDLFDYDKNNATGKPNGIDIKEQKMTLPLIYQLNHCSSGERRKIINIVKRHNNDALKVSEVLNKVNKGGGIDYARQKMFNYRDEAIQILRQLPESESRDALEQLVIFSTERIK